MACSACGSEEFHPLCNAIGAVMQLHAKVWYYPATTLSTVPPRQVCTECHQDWPCQTLRVLEQELSREDPDG